MLSNAAERSSDGGGAVIVGLFILGLILVSVGGAKSRELSVIREGELDAAGLARRAALAARMAAPLEA